MKNKWTILSIFLLLLTFACADKDADIAPPTPPPAQVEPEPVEIEEPVKPPVVVEEEPEDLDLVNFRKIKLDDVYFDFDKSELRDDTRMAIEQHARVLKANPKVHIVVEGHCDERGTEEYNIALGERRAERVRAYLESLGINASRMGTMSYGEMQPKSQGNDEQAWALNRRCHFVLELKK